MGDTCTASAEQLLRCLNFYTNQTMNYSDSLMIQTAKTSLLISDSSATIIISHKK